MRSSRIARVSVSDQARPRARRNRFHLRDPIGRLSYGNTATFARGKESFDLIVAERTGPPLDRIAKGGPMALDQAQTPAFLKKGPPLSDPALGVLNADHPRMPGGRIGYREQ